MIRRNDWGVLDATPLGNWTPVKSVSIVIPAFGSQEKLDLALAALAAQSYPEDLTEVVVVDDGSEPPLEARKPFPANLRVVSPEDGRWGIAAAVDAGIAASTGEVVLRLDSDVIASRHHVEAHMRWHHQVDYAVVIGKLSFAEIEPSRLAPDEVRDAVADNAGWRLFEGLDIDRGWHSKVILNRSELRKGDPQSFKVANGASVSFSRELYEAAGGVATDLLLGEDTELSYRLAQQGAVYIPDRAAEAWHIGESQMRTEKDRGMRYRQPFFAGRVPLLRHHRKIRGVAWRVPLVEVVIDGRGRTYEAVAATAGSVLSGDQTDVAVKLVGDWPAAAEGRYRPLEDTSQDARLIMEAFGNDQRVSFVDSVDATAAPTPFRLSLAAGITLRHDALESLLDTADLRNVGRVNCTLSGQDEPVAVRLDRTAAVARVLRTTGGPEIGDEAVEQAWGVWWADGDDWFAVADGTSVPWLRASGTQRELERLQESEAELRKQVERLKKSASDARASASRWEKSAREWEKSAAAWSRGSRPKAKRPRGLRRIARGVKRRLKQALGR
ncbi:glycosyltransferase [Glycomyces luteolus]|uniref:Glycosyltransferase n=1 Tax=Glycomyces luteolus TaxID=2670330 RepID=A0A9X3PPB6_9ACTN|nr:glycosyltransferase [Glycomyces luteolus]MDA1362540.1 glycosyltransferase [Glycomyces luteolus]